MPGNGGGDIDWGAAFQGGLTGGEGGTTGGGTGTVGGGELTAGEGGTGFGDADWGILKPDKPEEPAPRVPVIREARNVQRANIDRSSFYDPTAATQALGADYLQTRNASNPQPLGSLGAGAVGYEFVPSNERLY